MSPDAFELDSPSESGEDANAIDNALQQLLPGTEASEPAPVDDSEYGRLAGLWNSHVASCQGDTITTTGSRLDGVQPKVATYERILRHAWAPLRSLRRQEQTSARRARALTWEAWRSAQDGAIEQRLQNLRQVAHDFFLISRRFDCADYIVNLDGDSSRTWYQWLLQALDEDSSLTEQDRQELAARISKNPRNGNLHMLSQRLFLRWGSGKSDHAAVVAPPVAVQRGTASNLVAALHAACPKLDFRALLPQVARFVRTFWYHVAADSASGNERIRAELQLALAPYPNVILFWCACFAHLAALIASALLGTVDFLSPLYCLCKLLSQQDHTATWKAGMTLFVSKKHLQIPCSSQYAARTRERGFEAIDRICGMTVLREFKVLAANHPCSPQPCRMPQSYMDRVQCVKEFGLYWQLQGREASHYCDRQRVTCRCTTREEGIANSVESLFALIDPLMPTDAPADNKWESVSPKLSLLSFLILVMDVGPSGWLLSYPLDWSHRQVLVNDAAAGVRGDDYVLERSKRVLTVSKRFSDRGWKILVTLACPASLPIDRLLCFLLKADASENKDSHYTPLLFHLLHEGSNPVDVAMREVAELLAPGSDFMWVLNYWVEDAATRLDGPELDEFYEEWAWQALQMPLQQGGGMYYRLVLVLQSYPMLLFSVPAAVHFGITGHGFEPLGKAQRVFADHRRCSGCMDAACTLKLLALAQGPQDLLPGPGQPIGNALSAAARDISVANGDLERDNARHRHLFCHGHAPIQLDTMAGAAALHSVAILHQARGGRFDK